MTGTGPGGGVTRAAASSTAAPVVHDDRKGMIEIAQELREVIDRARAGKALPDELSGSTFTIATQPATWVVIARRRKGCPSA